jgi:hypothetical protein
MDNSQIPQEIKNFLESILNDANMSAEGTLREEMIKELYARLDEYLTNVIVDKMPAEHLEAFIKINEEGKSKEEIDTFLRSNLPNAQEVFTNAFADFRDLYLNNVYVSRNVQTKGE